MQAGGPRLEVDLEALADNWQLVCSRFQGRRVGAVVKHDAYGLGMKQVIPTLVEQGCRSFWVDTLERGLEARSLVQDVNSQVLVLYGLLGQDIAELAANGLTPVLTGLHEVAKVRDAAYRDGKVYRVAVHLDTGLTRLGLTATDVAFLAENPQNTQGMCITDWVTQLSRFDAPGDPHCIRQRERFDQWLAQLPAARRCVSTSAGIFSDASIHFDHARVGSALYGLDTSADQSQGLRVVATLKAPVLSVITAPPQTSIGYGGLFRTNRASRIATIAAGYGDGIPISLAQGGLVSIHGRLAPVVGGVAMGLFNVDVTDLVDVPVAPGDGVEIYGKNRSIGDVAALAGLPQAAILVPTAIKAERSYKVGMPCFVEDTQ